MKSVELKLVLENIEEVISEIVEGLESDELISESDLMRVKLVEKKISEIFKKHDECSDEMIEKLFTKRITECEGE